jgi:ABC-type uncharacterized transport system ATPase subunit
MQGMTKQDPECIANNDVTLKIKQGEVHALLGENGAGKSTLIKALYGVGKPDQGDMFFNGRVMNIKELADARDLGIGKVFQHCSLFETLTVSQNIAVALDTHRLVAGSTNYSVTNFRRPHHRTICTAYSFDSGQINNGFSVSQ